MATMTPSADAFCTPVALLYPPDVVVASAVLMSGLQIGRVKAPLSSKAVPTKVELIVTGTFNFCRSKSPVYGFSLKESVSRLAIGEYGPTSRNTEELRSAARASRATASNHHMLKAIVRNGALQLWMWAWQGEMG